MQMSVNKYGFGFAFGTHRIDTLMVHRKLHNISIKETNIVTFCQRFSLALRYEILCAKFFSISDPEAVKINGPIPATSAQPRFDMVVVLFLRSSVSTRQCLEQEQLWKGQQSRS